MEEEHKSIFLRKREVKKKEDERESEESVERGRERERDMAGRESGGERDKRRESGRRQKAESKAGPPGSRDVTHEGKGKGERGNPNRRANSERTRIANPKNI